MAIPPNICKHIYFFQSGRPKNTPICLKTCGACELLIWQTFKGGGKQGPGWGGEGGVLGEKLRRGAKYFLVM